MFRKIPPVVWRPTIAPNTRGRGAGGRGTDVVGATGRSPLRIRHAGRNLDIQVFDGQFAGDEAG